MASSASRSPRLGDDQRVDLHHRRVGGDERVVERGRELDELVHLRAVETDAEAKLPRLEGHEADARIDMDAHDLLGRLRGDFLDVHAAGGARHHHRLAGGAIEQQAQIQLALHLQSLFDQHASDDAAFRTGLVRDQRHADHLARNRLGFVGRFRELDAAAFAAAAGMNLRLDDDDRAAETARDRAGFGRVERDFAARHGHAVLRQNRFRLILVDFHRVDKP